MNPLVLKIVLNFVVAQIIKAIVKFDKQFDWDKLKNNLESKIRDIVPGYLFDDAVAALVGKIIASCDLILDFTDIIKNVIESVANQDFEGARIKLKQLISEVMNKQSGVFKAANPSASEEELDEQLIA